VSAGGRRLQDLGASELVDSSLELGLLASLVVKIGSGKVVSVSVEGASFAAVGAVAIFIADGFLQGRQVLAITATTSSTARHD